MKFSISEYRQSLGAWPPNMVKAGLSVAGASHFSLKRGNLQQTNDI
jgi:hypothetical protein